MGREITIDDNRDEKLQEKEEEIWVRNLGMKSENKMVIILLMWFHSIGYTPNWMEWKIEGMSDIGWNGFHHTPFHSIPFLQIQTMECGSFPLHSIPFHSIPPLSTNPNIAYRWSTIDFIK